MDDISQEEALKKLSTLSQRERQVLELRCQGLDYKTIGATLFVSVPSVKQYMSRIYVKLCLDLLSSSERTKVIYEIYCPLRRKAAELKKESDKDIQAPESGSQENEQPETPIPDNVGSMIDEDEYPIVVYEKPGPIIIDHEPLPIKPKRFGYLILLIGVVLGICFSLVIAYVVLRDTDIIPPLFPQPTQPIPTPLPQPTDLPILAPTMEIPTQTPIVIQEVIIVTATPPPVTEVPTLTPVPQPITFFSDNFDQGLSGSWSILSGNPVVVNGQLTTDEDTWIRIGDDSWTDYTIQMETVGGGCWFSNSWNTIAVRVQDMDNFIGYKWANCEDEWDIVKNGNWSKVPNSHGEHATYGKIRITLTAEGGQFSVDINGERVSSFFNSDFMQGGIALRVGAKTQIDNFKISAIQK
jgi:DNA-binding CsgD family transcriptional regulator